MKKSLITIALTGALLAAPLSLAPAANATTLHPSIATNSAPSVNEKQSVATVPTRGGTVTVRWPGTTKKNPSTFIVFVTHYPQGVLYAQPVDKTGKLALVHLLKNAVAKAKLGQTPFASQAALLKAIKAAVKGHGIKPITKDF